MATTFSRLALRLTSVAAALLFCAAAAAPAAEPQKPNVLLIITDDQGYGDFSLHGNPHLKTPHVDKLAGESVRFERFYVNAFCAPTRAALLTGRYPLRCGVWGVTHNKEAMRPDEVTLAEAFRAAGYRTGCFGKWHNGEQFPYTPTGQGFDEFFGFHNGHINNYFDAKLLRGSTPEPTRGYITDALAGEALRFIEPHRNRERPFFCYVAFNAPHSPFQVPDRDFDKFKAKGLADNVAAFYGMCENVDENVGRMLLALDTWDLARDTIVVFMTDNGGTAGASVYNAGMRGGKGTVHEGGCRVPLFIHWPKKLEPRVVTRIAAHIDLYPTLLDLCGVTPPKGPPLDGVNLRPLLEGRDSNWPERTLFVHHPTSDSNRYPGAVRTERYRLVREPRGRAARAGDDAATAWQLYDMQSDPGETKDLAAEHRDVVEKLSRSYEEWFDDVARTGRRRFPLPVGHAEENPVTLFAPQAYFSGLRFAAGPGYAHDYLTGWTDAKSKLWFEIDVSQAGQYEVELRYGCPAADAGSQIRVAAGDAAIETKVTAAEAPAIARAHREAEGHKRYVNREWGTLKTGRLRLAAGPDRLTIEALSMPGKQVMDFKEIVLRKVD
ncbi:MAG: sulfatase-like hydrolase/transferase [Planctomycetia bacterium]|nr:sulfatase-like hydrolase/transferase [Planctomycetia bacterium]